MAQALNVHPAELAQVLALLELAGEGRADTTLGAASIAELCRDAIPFAVEQGGDLCGAYAIKLAEHERARVAWVMAAGGRARGVDLTASVMPAIEHQARELRAAQVAITTRRRGLVQKLAAMGYTVAGITLRKNL